MDKVGQISMMANTEAIKEPRGFIKFLQIILAIFAFATTTAYYDEAKFQVVCTQGKPKIGILSFQYTFRLDTWSMEGCNATTERFGMYGDFSSPAQFYVFVGVMAFLYSLAALALYVFADDKYHQNDSVPCVDLVITAVFVLMWLISSSAWADGLSKIKHYTDPQNLYINDDIPITRNYTVNVLGGTSYASLNVSIIFGFLNMLVWAGNIWFLYKETKWFGGNREAQPQFTGAGSPTTPQ